MEARTIFFHRSTGVMRPGWRIAWLLLWVMPAYWALILMNKVVAPHLPAPLIRPMKILAGLAFIPAALWIYRAFARAVERREPTELALGQDTGWHTGLGFLMGGGVMLLITGILAAAGSYHVASIGSPWSLWRALYFYLPQTFIEDFVFGLVLYRLLREGIGRRWALAVAPILFAAAHTGNDNESLLGLAEIFTAGWVMYYVFERTGRFWTVWALHFSWNFTMNGVLGMANSGQDLGGFFHPTITGPAWFTGGATGPEASVLAVGLDLLLLLLLWKASDRTLRSRSLWPLM
jgi:membrane protease YdiL (CAAX protease family)